MSLSRRPIIALLALGFASTLASARDCPHPFEDPKNDFCNPLRYIPSNTLTGISFAIFFVVAIAQSWLTYKHGAKYMFAMVIGCYTFVLGFGIRFGLPPNPQTLGIYIGQQTLIVLSPCAFIAANYVLLGRLARYVDRNRHLPIRPTRIAIIFVTSDAITFLIQAGGGGISASADGDRDKAEIGSNVFFGGLIVQLTSFFFFSLMLYAYLLRIYTYEKDIWGIHSHRVWYRDWRSLAGAQCISSVGILIRSVYRTIELSEGYAGPLSTSEALFYLLDTLPLFVAIVVYIPFWPGRFITPTYISEDPTKYGMEDRQKGALVEAIPVVDGSARISD